MNNKELLTAALELSKYAAAPLVMGGTVTIGKGDDAIKVPRTTEEWWEGLREQIEAIQPELEKALAAAPTAPAQDNLWQQAVLNECFAIEGCYKESDPAGTLTCLINWHVLNERDHAPAQEDEPVAVSINGQLAHLPNVEKLPHGTELYTRSDSELRKAAEDAAKLLAKLIVDDADVDTDGEWEVLENLRAALEGKS